MKKPTALVCMLLAFATAPALSLDLFYDFEGDSGTTVTDKLDSDGAQNGTIFNNVEIETAQVPFGEQAARFSPPTPGELFSTIEIPGSTELGSAFTIAANVSFENTGFTRLFTSYRGTGAVGDDRIILDMDPSGSTISGLRLIVHNTVAVTAEVPAGLAEPGYHHIAATYDDGAVAVYLDGVDVGVDPGTLGSGPVTMTQNLRFGEDPHDGGGSANEQFRGNVDELLVLGRALSAEEVAAIAEAGVAGNVAPAEGELAIYYDFEPPDADTAIGDRFGDNHGIAHNNVLIDADTANARFGAQSAVIGDKLATVPFSIIEVGQVGSLGNSFTLAATINVPGGGHAGGGLARLFSTFAGTGSPAGRLILDFNPAASVAGIGIRLILPDGTSLTYDGTFTVDENHHLAATYDGGDVSLWLDGEAVASTSTPGGEIDLGEFLLRIGEDLGGAVNENFVGVLDEVLVLSRALDAGEIAAIAEFGFGSEPPPAGTAVAGDCNVDGSLDIGDLTCYTKSLFPQFSLLDRGPPPAAPCEGDLGSAGNLALLDLNGDERVDGGDAVALGNYLFGLGGPPVQGTGCIAVGDELGCGVHPGCE